ncbi:MAG: D-tyrosyl-tRNA(Tyr) deacylase [FCB group bacterium]|nr:D-tyrosyl-tRNA(Tyr) deacylase [FCB group bacterium]
MIAVLQRVSQAGVEVGGETVGAIGAGLLILLGVSTEDSEQDADYLATKIAGLRIFPDSKGNMNISLQDVRGSALVVSQFTLCANCQKGKRPSFNRAAPAEMGKRLYRYFIERLRAQEVPVETGIFGAMMEVQLINQGPVTIVLDSKEK